MIKNRVTFFLACIATLLFANTNVQAQMFDQRSDFTREDSLRGSITPERAWWDLTDYHLDVTLDIPDKYLSGSNTISYRVLEPYDVMQIDRRSRWRLPGLFRMERNFSSSGKVLRGGFRWKNGSG